MTVPKVFISYSWDGEAHQAWVRDLAIRLRSDGVDASLDQWQVRPGDQLPAFMEQSIRNSAFVLIVCTPRYKAKSDGRLGGVAYEEDIIQGEVFTNANHRKFIPILRSGSWPDAAPASLLGKAYLDFREGGPYAHSYAALVRTLHGESPNAPPIGKRPDLSFGFDKSVSMLTVVDESLKYGVSRMDVTPDGRVAIATSWVGCRLSVWSFPEGRRVHSIDASRGDSHKHVNDVSISPDGQLALVVRDETVISLYDLHTAKELPAQPHSYFYGHRRIHADFSWTRAACAGWQQIHVIRISDFQLLKRLVTPDEGFWKSRLNPYGLLCLAVDRDFNTAITGSNHNDLKVWDLNTGRELRTLHGHGNSVLCVAMRADGEIAVSGSRDKTLKVWDLRTGRELRTLTGHSGSVNDVRLVQEGTIAISGSSDTTVKLWNVESGQLLFTLEGHAKEVTAVAFGGRYVFSGADGNTIKMWEMA